MRINIINVILTSRKYIFQTLKFIIVKQSIFFNFRNSCCLTLQYYSNECIEYEAIRVSISISSLIQPEITAMFRDNIIINAIANSIR